MRNKQEKKKAVRLRRNGKSYNEISRKLDIPKSTLSLWFRKIEWNKELIRKIWDKKRKKCAENITLYNKQRAQIIKEQHLNFQKQNADTIKKLSEYELKLIGTALYWAEGSKNDRWVITFVNSDPEMIKIMMRFFKEVCRIPKERISFKIQIHPNISEKSAKLFWSKILNIPVNKFTKTLYQISKASKGKRPKRTLPYGTCRISIANVLLRNQIVGWIKGIINQI
jgi:transposase-like protein